MNKFNLNFLCILLVFAAFLATGCDSNKQNKEKDPAKEKNTTEKEQKLKDKMPTGKGSLGDYDISSESPERIALPTVLMEVSGITFTEDNRMFAHGDEDGDVFEIDPASGKIIKQFSIGSFLTVKGDFEDITYAKGKFYLIESNLSLIHI